MEVDSSDPAKEKAAKKEGTRAHSFINKRVTVDLVRIQEKADEKAMHNGVHKETFSVIAW